MSAITIDRDRCKKCGLCGRVCPRSIFVQQGKLTIPDVLEEEHCIACGQCLGICPSGAISHSGFPSERISPIQFGAILISGLAVGAVTPPVGTCMNVAAAISGLGIGAVFRGTAPFLAANLLTLILISVFPQLTLWIPSLFQ